MAAVAELSVLLFALINNIHAEELLIIREERGSYAFNLPKDANSCLISRFVGEEKLVLWNTSDVWSQNSTSPEDLKQLSAVSRENIYVIRNLTHSDSGPYQEECLTDGKVTHEKNISMTVCGTIDEMMSISLRVGGTVGLPCFGAADNLDFLWLKREFRYEQETWTRVFGDNTTSVMDNVNGRYEVEKHTSALLVSNFTTTGITVFTCLVMNQQQCVSSRPVNYDLGTEIIYHSVEETAVLPCTVTNDQPPLWMKFDWRSNTGLGLQNHTVDQNYSLMFPSLTLSHSGVYYCEASMRMQTYQLLVCPRFGPPAVKLFSEGEDVTLRCKDWVKGVHYFWFIKSIQTEGRVFSLVSNLSMSFLSRLTLYPSNGSFVISNVSLKDTGEYWCAVIGADGEHCLSTAKTLLQYRDPFGVHSTFYKVRCSVLSVLLVLLCVVVVAVNQWARRVEQL